MEIIVRAWMLWPMDELVAKPGNVVHAKVFDMRGMRNTYISTYSPTLKSRQTRNVEPNNGSRCRPEIEY